MMDKYLDKLFPPGYDREKELRQLIVRFIIAVLNSFRFFIAYHAAYDDLFYYDMLHYNATGELEKTLIPGAVILPFKEIVGYSFIFFVVFALTLLAAAGQHYWYYLKGSKSIYLVRRLPERYYTLKTCLGVTTIGIGLMLLTVGLLLGIFYLVYIFVTPAGCLP